MQYLVSVIDDGQAAAAQSADSATASEMAAIDNRGAEPVFTDGPFLESKEFLAGFWIMEASDLDVALRLAAAASKACNRRIEVRPFA